MTPNEIVYFIFILQSAALVAVSHNKAAVQGLGTYASFDVWTTIASSHREST